MSTQVELVDTRHTAEGLGPLYRYAPRDRRLVWDHCEDSLPLSRSSASPLHERPALRYNFAQEPFRIRVKEFDDVSRVARVCVSLNAT